MDLEIDENSALVLASSSGLGRASAEALVKEGVNVAINGRSEEKLEGTREELTDIGGGEVMAVKGDITKKEEIDRIVNTTVREFGGLDHLVTCAGGPPSKKFMETTDEEWQFSYDLLVMSVVRAVQASIEHLKKDGGGTIVNITSISVKESLDNLVLSNSVRMAVIGLMKTLSFELAPEIRANAVLPGYHETDRVKGLIEKSIERGDVPSYEEGLSNISENVPLNRIGDPIELGELVAYLCSNRSQYINGASIPIDGGFSKSNL